MAGVAFILVVLQGIGTLFSILLYLYLSKNNKSEEKASEEDTEEKSVLEGINNDEYLAACKTIYKPIFDKSGTEDCKDFIEDFLQQKQHSNEPLDFPEGFTELDNNASFNGVSGVSNDYTSEILKQQDDAPREMKIIAEQEESLNNRKSSNISDLSLLEEMKDSLNQSSNYYSGIEKFSEIPPEQDSDPEGENIKEILNLLDKECINFQSEENNPFLEVQEENNPFLDQDTVKKKKFLTERLSYLANLGEGTKNLKEIILTLHELYRIEGREEDMQSLKKQHSSFFTDEHDILYKEDIIFLGMQTKSPFTIPKRYEWLATDKIADKKLGKQKWIGHVVGKNQDYIHFQDKSQRIWIRVGEKVKYINLWDMLVVNVERTEETVTAGSILLLNEINTVS